MALNAIGLAQLECFEQLEGVEALERAARLAEADGDDYEVGRALGNLGAALGEIRRYEQAAAYLERAIAFSEERDLDDTDGTRDGRPGEDPLRAGALGRGGSARGLGAPTPRALPRDPDRRPLRPRPHRRPPRRSRGGVVPGRGLGALARHRRPGVGLAGRGRARRERPGSQAATTRSQPLVEPAYEQACAAGLRWAIGELGSWLVRARALERLPEDAAPPYRLPWREAAEAWRRIGCPYEQAEALADGDEAAMRESLAILTRLGAEPAADRVREQHAPRRRQARAGAAACLDAQRAGAAHAAAARGSGAPRARAEQRRDRAEAVHLREDRRSTTSRRSCASSAPRSRGEAAAAARKMGIPAAPT